MKKTSVLLVFCLVIFACKSDSPVIETIDGNKITVKSFEESYKIALETMSRMRNIDKKTLDELIEKDIDELPNQEMKALNYQFQKENYYENFRQMLMTKIAADRSGFSDRKDIKAIVDQVVMQTISQLYLQELLDKKIVLSENEIMEECQQLRKENQEVKALPVDKCLTYAESRLKGVKSQEYLPKLLEKIKEGIVIKHNDNFDLDQYINKKKNAKKSSEMDDSTSVETDKTTN